MKRFWMALGLAGLMAVPVPAAPQGGVVTVGTATITPNGTTTTINQTSVQAIVNWGSFNVLQGESVVFNLPGTGAAILNRVNVGNPSTIAGSLIAPNGGTVFLVNPSGIFFGGTAQVNVGSFLASTADISNANFQASNFTFASGAGLSPIIVSPGATIGANSGFVVLAAPLLDNEGQVGAIGNVSLAAASGFSIDGAGTFVSVTPVLLVPGSVTIPAGFPITPTLSTELTNFFPLTLPVPPPGILAAPVTLPNSEGILVSNGNYNAANLTFTSAQGTALAGGQATTLTGTFLTAPGTGQVVDNKLTVTSPPAAPGGTTTTASTTPNPTGTTVTLGTGTSAETTVGTSGPAATLGVTATLGSTTANLGSTTTATLGGTTTASVGSTTSATDTALATTSYATVNPPSGTSLTPTVPGGVSTTGSLATPLSTTTGTVGTGDTTVGTGTATGTTSAITGSTVDITANGQILASTGLNPPPARPALDAPSLPTGDTSGPALAPVQLPTSTTDVVLGDAMDDRRARFRHAHPKPDFRVVNRPGLLMPHAADGPLMRRLFAAHHELYH
ncbi:MAG: two-partner secretion domain-containing protein [Candidatus Xenobia bacterium]